MIAHVFGKVAEKFGGAVIVDVAGIGYEVNTPTSDFDAVKLGDEVEAGDLLSDGIPNLSKIVPHKGIDYGRELFSVVTGKPLPENWKACGIP